MPISLLQAHSRYRRPVMLITDGKAGRVSNAPQEGEKTEYRKLRPAPANGRAHLVQPLLDGEESGQFSFDAHHQWVSKLLLEGQFPPLGFGSRQATLRNFSASPFIEKRLCGGTHASARTMVAATSEPASSTGSSPAGSPQAEGRHLVGI